MVPGTGLEPVRPFWRRRITSRLRHYGHICAGQNQQVSEFDLYILALADKDTSTPHVSIRLTIS